MTDTLLTPTGWPTTIEQKLKRGEGEPKIDTDIPLPERRQGNNFRVLASLNKFEVWDKMEIGHSFAVPEGYTNSSVRSAAYEAGCRLGWQFSVHANSEETRVWRTK
jgi:hypothetical protein